MEPMNLSQMIKRLALVQRGMDAYRTKRLQEKWDDRETYEGHSLQDIMENLGRNLVQFTTMVAMGDQKGILKQGADILNLTLMSIDKSTGILK